MANEEVLEFIRFWLGGLPTSTISDETIIYIIEQVRLAHVDITDCQLKYYSIVAVLEWLIRKNYQDGGSTGGSGSVRRVKEVVGRKSREIEYQNNESGSSGYQSILDGLLNDPTSIGCDPFPSDGNAQGLVLIGGVDADAYQANLDNPLVRNGFDINVNNVVNTRPSSRRRRTCNVKFYDY